MGSGADADVRVNDDVALGVQAIVRVAPGKHVIIQRAGNAALVRINGVTLGVEPTPLMHGDKIEIAGQDLFYSEDSKAGKTGHVTVEEVAAAGYRRSGPARATEPTGGRLYQIARRGEAESRVK